MAAEHLLGEHRRLEALVGQIALDDRRQQAEQVVGLGRSASSGERRTKVDQQRAPQHQRPPGLVPGLRLHQHPANVGMDDDRVRLGAGLAIASG